MSTLLDRVNAKCRLRHPGILLGVVVLAVLGAFLMRSLGRGPVCADAGEDTHVGAGGGKFPQAISVSAGVKAGIRVDTPSLTVGACNGRGL